MFENCPNVKPHKGSNKIVISRIVVYQFPNKKFQVKRNGVCLNTPTTLIRDEAQGTHPFADCDLANRKERQILD